MHSLFFTENVAESGLLIEKQEAFQITFSVRV